jgi:hypothetical protein
VSINSNVEAEDTEKLYLEAEAETEAELRVKTLAYTAKQYFPNERLCFAVVRLKGGWFVEVSRKPIRKLFKYFNGSLVEVKV